MAQAHSKYVIYIELEINILEATCSKDLRKTCFSLLPEAVATSAILFCM